MNTYEIRLATPMDAEEILKIYEPYILNTVITFEYDIPSLDEFRARIENTLQRFPYYVAHRTIDHKIMGYAYASSFKTRAAYDWSCELSIYLDPECKGNGLGKRLYKKLEETLTAQNIHNLCACIAYPNPESVGFHKALGFTENAHFHKSGYKFGKWHDMIWMEKFVHEHEETPLPFIPFPDLNDSTKG